MAEAVITTTVEDPIDIIKMLMTVSEDVSEYINTQSYILDSDVGVDGVDIAGTAVQCYLILIDELRRKGVLFHTTDELLENWADAERIYHLHQWLDTANQVEIIKNHTDLIPILDNILHNSDTEEDTLTSWLNAVLPKTSMDIHILAAKDLLDYIETNDDFKEFLEAIFENTKFAETEFKQPLEVIQAFIQAMYQKQQDAKTALELLRKSNLGQDNTIASAIDELLSKINDYDVNKLQADCISDYAWAWTIESGYEDSISYDELPDSLKKKYDDLELEHHSSTPHHVEYYLVHKDVPMTVKSIIALVTAIYKSHTEKDRILDACDEIVIELGDRLDDNLRKLMTDIIDIYNQEYFEDSDRLDIAEEKFFTNIKTIADIILKTPRISQKVFIQEAEAGDIVLSYKKPSKLNYFNRFSSWLTSTFQGMRYNSSKMIYITPEGKKMVVGYGVSNNGTDFSKMFLQSYLNNCGGCLLIRHSNINDAKREKLNKLIGEVIEKDLVYSNKTIITTAISHILKKSFKKNSKEDKHRTALICSTIIAILFRQVGLSMGSMYSDTEIWPVDIIQSPKLNKIGMYFARNEYNKDDLINKFNKSF